MKLKTPVIVLFALALLCASVFSQDLRSQEGDNLKKFHKYDFSKQLLKKTDLNKLEHYELQQLRGIVFGKRGRIFVEKSIQEYLAKQSWYKPNSAFKNSVLTANERKNIDLIREVEANKHDHVEPGDLRWWKTNLIPEEKLATNTAAEWDIMIAEIEAIHGKTFPDQEWLQKYFDERYWYKRKAAYSPTILTATERKNMQTLIDARNKYRKAEISPGDMDKFRNVLIKEAQLKGSNLNDLRIMRNEFFARRGMKFTTPGYLSFFEWQDWYKPIKDQSKVKLNTTEEANVDLIKSVEAKIREELSTRELTDDDLGGLFTEDLRILRNEIFARRGWVFKDKDLQKTFQSMDWYKPDPEFTAEKVPTVLTELEFKNVTKLKEFEQLAISKFSVVEG